MADRDEAGKSLLDRYFEITDRGSSVGREVLGGLVTFVTVAYIIVLNPLILGSYYAADAGAKRDVLGNILPVSQVAACTALVAARASSATCCCGCSPAGPARSTR
jgi:AGZA family xanthine/uracil permease-like MFS transporter